MDDRAERGGVLPLPRHHARRQGPRGLRRDRHDSYLAKNLPIDQTVFARVWTKVGGVWRYTDGRFKGAPLTTSLVYPSAGSVNADIGLPIRWTPVPNAQAYYLYLGTTLGAKDLVDTGAIQQTSYSITNVPLYQRLYARIWVKINGVWRYTDSSFSGAVYTAFMVSPANGALNADLGVPIKWTTVANAEAYYLYLGTTPGAKNLVDTGSILQTSFLAKDLPPNQTIYARLWTRVAGIWRYNDSSFSAGLLVSKLTYPAQGATSIDPNQAWTWISVPNAQAYYLYIGTSPGANDLVDTHEIQTTSYTLRAALPPNQTLYARLWTKVGGIWRYSDIWFRAALVIGRLTYPPNGGAGVDQTRPATWTSAPDAQAYYLYIGTTLGGRDVLDSAATQLTFYPIAGLPSHTTLYARLWTLLGGVWRYSDSTFSAGPIAPEFTYPLNGATAVDPAQPFTWIPPAGAQAHTLMIGTSPGANDVMNSGEIKTTSQAVPALPARTLYARVWSKVNGGWTRHSDITFTPRDDPRRAFMIAPAGNGAAFDTGQPFQWSSAVLAKGYRLTIGTSPGATDLHDSGVVQSTRRFVRNLPIGVPLFGRLQTQFNGEWSGHDFQFTATSNTFSPPAAVATALWATHQVRRMAPTDNRPFGWTPLLAAIAPRYAALCSDYAAALLQLLADINIGTPVRRLDLSFNGTDRSAHTLVEMLDPASGRWMLLDPTFDLTVLRPDGSWATAEDVSNATRTWRWTDITYDFLGSAGDQYVRSYYLDYPLLYANVIHEGQSFIPNSSWFSPLPFMREVSVPDAGTALQAYAVRCTGTLVAQTVIDGVLTSVACDGVDATSAVFVATTVAAPAGQAAGFRLYQVDRYVF